MQLTSVIIVLIHLLYATAWAAPTRLDNELLPRGPFSLQSLKSKFRPKKEPSSKKDPQPSSKKDPQPSSKKDPLPSLKSPPSSPSSKKDPLSIGGNQPSESQSDLNKEAHRIQPESQSDLNKEAHRIQLAVKSIKPNEGYIGEGSSGKVYGLKDLFRVGDEEFKAVVKVVRVRNPEHEKRLRNEIRFLKKVEQYLGVGIGEWPSETNQATNKAPRKTYYIVMRYMGRTMRDMLNSGIDRYYLEEAALSALRYYDYNYGMRTTNHDVERDLYNFVFEISVHGVIVAHMIDWEHGYESGYGLRPPMIKVDLKKEFPEEHWREESSSLLSYDISKTLPRQ